MRRLRAAEGGFLAIWLLGVCFVLLALGGVSLDLWRVFAARQELAGIADAAALAGASGIDQAAARRGTVVLDQPDAERLAALSVAAQTDRSALVSWRLSVSPDGQEVTVVADGRASLTLLRLLAGRAGVTLQVTSSAAVHRTP